MNKAIINIRALDKAVLDRDVLASGQAPDNEDGLNMTGSGKALLWVAKRGAVGDWCVYCHWLEKGIDFVLSQGDKVHDRRNIENIINIDDEVWTRYRH